MARVEIDNVFDEIVTFAEIGEFLHLPVKRYSSGMYVRLAFAVAAHLDPTSLFLMKFCCRGRRIPKNALRKLMKLREVENGRLSSLAMA